MSVPAPGGDCQKWTGVTGLARSVLSCRRRRKVAMASSGETAASRRDQLAAGLEPDHLAIVDLEHAQFLPSERDQLLRQRDRLVPRRSIAVHDVVAAVVHH